MSIDHIRERLARHFNPAAAEALDRVYQFRIADTDHFHLKISEGRLTVHPGRHQNPSVTMLFPDEDTALSLLEGSLDPMQAFLNGQIRSDGHLIFALQLGGLFRS